MNRRIAGALFLGSVLAFPEVQARAAADPLVFVVSTRAQIISVSSAELKRIYLGRVTRWSTGRRISLAVRPDSKAVGRAFFDRVVHMSTIDFSQMWLGIVFRGEAATSPRVIDSPEEVARFLFRNPDGLVVAFDSEIDPLSPLVRPLEVDGKKPTDPGYPFAAER